MERPKIKTSQSDETQLSCDESGALELLTASLNQYSLFLDTVVG